MNSELQRFSWLFRYKIHHFVFWAIYHFSWWSIYEGSAPRAFEHLLHGPGTFKFLFYVIFQTAGVYFCLYVLIPQYLERGRYFLFVLYSLMTIAIVATVIMSGYFLGAAIYQSTVEELYKINKGNPIAIIKYNTLASTITVITLGMSIKLAKNYLASQEHRRILEKEKLETELKFLKSQFNPHFLFNTINSIFVLINKNAEMASDSLAKFSGLLRYQLYECNEAQIPLQREIAYLKSFIELEELRLNDNANLNVNLDVSSTTDLMIAPFILMPFIENAFKHVSQFKEKSNWIDIQLKVADNDLIFNVENSVSTALKNSKEVVDYSGVGLENVKRRLLLLYKDNHEMEIFDSGPKFSVKLIISLANN